MSLDLSAKTGRAHNVAAFAAADFSGVDISTFDSGDVANAGKFLLHVDMSGGAMDANTMPVTLLDANGAELLEDGVEISIIKNDVSSNNLTFVDPVTGITYDYVNRRGESLTLVMDRSTGAAQWVAKV